MPACTKILNVWFLSLETLLSYVVLPVRIFKFFCDVIELIPGRKSICTMLLAVRCWNTDILMKSGVISCVTGF